MNDLYFCNGQIGYYLGFAEMLLELKLKGRERLEK